MSTRWEDTMSDAAKRGPGRPSTGEIKAEAGEAAGREMEVYGKREIRLDEIDARFGGEGFEYHGDLVVGEIKGILRHVEYEFLEIGRRLILIKEHEGHGNFMSRLDTIGMPEKTANNFMRATIAAQSMGFLPAPGQIRRQSADLKLPSMSKILEITFLGDDDLAELGEGGTVAGLHLDDIDRMSVREVREEVIRKKEEKISELERQLRGLPPVTQRDVNQERLKELEKTMLARCFEIRGLVRSLADVIREARSLPEVDVLDLHDWVGRVVDWGTSHVNDDWEEVMEPLEDITPLDVADVQLMD